MSKQWNRWMIYVLGLLTLAVGLSLCTKADLGIMPILSVSYALSRILDQKLGDVTFLLYCAFVAGEFLLRGKNRRWTDLFQLPLSLVFGQMLNVLGDLLAYDGTQHALPTNLAVLALAILCTGAGICMSVNMRLVPNPGDGIVQALAERMSWEQGLAKNVFDLGCVITTVILSLALTGRVIGLGIGTIAAMLGVGRVVSLINRLTKEKMCLAAGLL